MKPDELGGQVNGVTGSLAVEIASRWENSVDQLDLVSIDGSVVEEHVRAVLTEWIMGDFVPFGK
jgi:hypothetical protein